MNMLYDAFQEKCLQLFDRIGKAETEKAKTQACYDLADLKVAYYGQFHYPDCSTLAKFYDEQLSFALLERAEIVDKLHDLGIEIK